MGEQRKRPKAVHTGVVESTERLTDGMVRVVLGGDGLSGFEIDGCTDSYVKLLLRADGGPLPEPFDYERFREQHPKSEWPVKRTYTVRAWDPDRRRLTIDFVVHGDRGVAGPWAAAARPGDRLHFMGPGGGYAPGQWADWHLLAGDDSALPAIAAAVEALPDRCRAHVFVEVEGPQHEQHVAVPDGVQVTWLHRGQQRVGTSLVPAVRELDFPDGAVHAFVHGEANFVKELRSLLRVEHGIPKKQLSISGYWKRGGDEDAWQAGKAEFNRAIEEEEAARIAAA
ncbi:siderophore-interacting protein [Saccharopolyspora sp. HNM0983]|uniref:Siderophore-interacting protein n=1 Tax=Saccharopolyspora montiporae TaxID=2781240 RepID=A0A929G0P2_9PSEU|nr:siderophore-interacting protein [Saccharopolyspora sp. HNM0983]